MKYWFSSDLHLGHARILEFCSGTRQGNSVEEHDEILVREWNSVVGHGDVCYILGDECLGNRDEGYARIARLNGQKHLIRGNHTQLKKEDHKKIFQSISDYKEITVKRESGSKQKIVMCHFPIISWNNMAHGSWMLHGHCHGNLHDFGGKMLDVGIDTRPNKDMKPWSFEDIDNYMRDRAKSCFDHHEDGVY